MQNILEQYLHRERVAHFSMEVGLRNEIHTYSGGLGMLAGDTLRSAADLGLPLVGVTLISRQGYFRQELDEDGHQRELPEPWEPERWARRLPAKVAVVIDNRQIWVQGWLYEIQGRHDNRVPVILLDTDLPENTDGDRGITDLLYGDGPAYRLQQEIILGVGGTRLLHALGFRIHTYHMNEGHSALLGLELLRRFEHSRETVGPDGDIYNVELVRERCLFTTHTPVQAGHDQFDYQLADRLLSNIIEPRMLRRLAGDSSLNMTRLALRLSGYVNGVAKRHAEVSEAMFPGYHVHAITNGVHPATWTAPEFQALYDQHVPNWRHEPELLTRADRIEDVPLWTAHMGCKQRLLARVADLSGQQFDPEIPVIGFARRMTAYKRATLLFSDADRLAEIARRHPIQIVFAGKAHPQDMAGKRLIEALHALTRRLPEQVRAAFLPNYDMELAQLLVAGSDLWLNTPLRPLEASGTSGMKAAFNGVPHFSVLDGWWIEGCIEGATGWTIGSGTDAGDGEDAEGLYRKLEQAILPLYYDDRSAWIEVMRGAICKNASYFNSQRMMRHYAASAYLR